MSRWQGRPLKVRGVDDEIEFSGPALGAFQTSCTGTIQFFHLRTNTHGIAVLILPNLVFVVATSSESWSSPNNEQRHAMPSADIILVICEWKTKATMINDTLLIFLVSWSADYSTLHSVNYLNSMKYESILGSFERYLCVRSRWRLRFGYVGSVYSTTFCFTHPRLDFKIVTSWIAMTTPWNGALKFLSFWIRLWYY